MQEFTVSEVVEFLLRVILPTVSIKVLPLLLRYRQKDGGIALAVQIATTSACLLVLPTSLAWIFPSTEKFFEVVLSLWILSFLMLDGWLVARFRRRMVTKRQRGFIVVDVVMLEAAMIFGVWLSIVTVRA